MKFLMLSLALYVGTTGSSVNSGPDWVVIEEEGEETVIIDDGNYGCIEHIEMEGDTWSSTFYGDCGSSGPQQ